MTILYTNEAFQSHVTGPEHPEKAARLVSIEQHLHEMGLVNACTRGDVLVCDVKELERTHSLAQINAARQLAAAGGGFLDADTQLSLKSYQVALQAAGTATAAVDAVLSGAHKNALCLIRPPGHHATHSQSMGFCLFNNIAVAARHAQTKHGLGKVLIVDWDVHHGNGTQDIFYNDESVVFFSIHRFPFYPGTGGSGETGTGQGLGATINVPVTYGTGAMQYMDMFRRGLEAAAAKAKPDLILISAGFDAHGDDPVGDLGLSSSDFAIMTTLVQQVADTYCHGRVVSCLEGGYNLTALAESVESHLRILTQQ